jgi:hypothetical protein
MAKEHTVRPGDCISSIAFENGFFPDTIWNHGRNAELKALRQNPNVLSPGDVVHVPDRRERVETRGTDASHRFKKRGVPAKLRVVLREDDEPVAGKPFLVVVDGIEIRGTTGGDGLIEVSIPPNARRAELTIGDGDDALRSVLQLGHMDAIDDVAGAQSRLRNLGYACEADGEMGPGTAEALRHFQEDHELPVTGELDAATRAKLLSSHDG